MPFGPAALPAAASVLNGVPASPLPALAAPSLTYQTSVLTVIVTVAVAVSLGSLLPAIVYWKASVPVKPALGA